MGSFKLRMQQNPFSTGALPRTPLGELTTLPQTTFPSPSTLDLAAIPLLLKEIYTNGQNRPKYLFFCYKFAPKKKSRGSIQKLEYRCTTRNLPLCNGTIIVLRISLLHSVSVITNFVIPKCDKQTDKKNHHTFSSTAGARPTIPTILGMVIEEVRPVFALP